jgi:hypothetical protein
MNARRAALILVLAGALAAIASLGFFFFRDNFSTHYPLKAVSAAAWRAGAIPWWNASDGGGQPLAGNPNALTFYPDNVLYLLLPLPVAFNLHFLLHLVAGWLAMGLLVQTPGERRAVHFAATLWILSGAAISALAFYNLIPAIALLPLALLATERRSIPLLGISFGLLALAGEPVTLLAAALACACVARAWKPLLLAAPLAALMAMPQVLAYSEIAREVERAHGYSVQTVLNASLDPRRLLELLIGPFVRIDEPHLFPTLLIGLIVLPALFRRSRYTLAAAVMLFFALGRFNPLVRMLAEVPALRVVRYPEKFALPLCALLVVLAGRYFGETKHKRAWAIVTFVPLVTWAAMTIPIDWWTPYRMTAAAGRRFVSQLPGGQTLDREDYHRRARALQPLFGSAGGMQYVLNRSGDGMHSLLSRIAAERFGATGNRRYLAIALLPPARIAPRQTFGAQTVNDAVNFIESGAFDEQTTVIVPQPYASLTSPTGARVTRYRQLSDRIEIDVTSPGRALLLVNQSYFRAWDAGNLPTLPANLDRLGVIIPAGTRTITLRFGRHRTAVVAAWVVSSLLLVVLAGVQLLDRSSGQIERAGDEDHVR